eukprot:gene6313-1740_t
MVCTSNNCHAVGETCVFKPCPDCPSKPPDCICDGEGQAAHKPPDRREASGSAPASSPPAEADADAALVFEEPEGDATPHSSPPRDVAAEPEARPVPPTPFVYGMVKTEKGTSVPRPAFSPPRDPEPSGDRVDQVTVLGHEIGLYKTEQGAVFYSGGKSTRYSQATLHKRETTDELVAGEYDVYELRVPIRLHSASARKRIIDVSGVAAATAGVLIHTVVYHNVELELVRPHAPQRPQQESAVRPLRHSTGQYVFTAVGADNSLITLAAPTFKFPVDKDPHTDSYFGDAASRFVRNYEPFGGRFPVVQRVLFCEHCNLLAIPAVDFQTGKQVCNDGKLVWDHHRHILTPQAVPKSQYRMSRQDFGGTLLRWGSNTGVHVQMLKYCEQHTLHPHIPVPCRTGRLAVVKEEPLPPGLSSRDLRFQAQRAKDPVSLSILGVPIQMTEEDIGRILVAPTNPRHVFEITIPRASTYDATSEKKTQTVYVTFTDMDDLERANKVLKYYRLPGSKDSDGNPNYVLSSIVKKPPFFLKPHYPDGTDGYLSPEWEWYEGEVCGIIPKGFDGPTGYYIKPRPSHARAIGILPEVTLAAYAPTRVHPDVRFAVGNKVWFLAGGWDRRKQVLKTQRYGGKVPPLNRPLVAAMLCNTDDRDPRFFIKRSLFLPDGSRNPEVSP